ncbi:unnamed protein product [Musa acuminata subsp. malaccensis]|uniref:(wild Malaysian banana) hypothetical protein n=1 Tax=Musa acuminata subsp. malaccensis TaxID=214687 RepID=A0A804IMA1_MUSAM|nr:PREDICTED: high mobility group B protein 14-like [Musa acuminata subsp. malaccensis]CAG1841530.1 unnamed protein product [Musa acuminata subsp. malaccensis]
METRAKRAKATETATKPRKDASKKPKAKAKRKPSSSAKNDHRDKPKKPPTAFFYYLEDFRKTFQQENPNVKSMRDIGKACGEKWKTMSFEEKVAYYDIATEKRAEFEKAMAAYIKRMESGEFSEGSDDYE